VSSGLRRYAARQTTATWDPENWIYLAYLARERPAHPGTLDLRAFLDDLVERDVVTGQEWLASIEIGNEVVSGRGVTRLTEVGVELQ